MTSIQTYIQYTTPDGKKYYYDQATKQTTYQFPSNALIYDSKTKQIINTPPGVKIKITEAQTQSNTNTANQSQTFQANNAQPPPFQNIAPKLGPKSLQPNFIPTINPPSPAGMPNQHQSQAKIANPLQPQLVQIPTIIQSPPQASPQSTPLSSHFPQNPVLIPPAISTQAQYQPPQATHQPINTTIPQINPQQLNQTISPLQVQQIKPMQLPNSSIGAQPRIPQQSQSISPQFNPQSTQLIQPAPPTQLNQQTPTIQLSQPAPTILPNQSAPTIQLNQPSQPTQLNQPISPVLITQPLQTTQLTPPTLPQNQLNNNTFQQQQQQQAFLNTNQQIESKKSLPDLPTYSQFIPQPSNTRTLTQFSSSDFQGFQSNAPLSPNNQQTTTTTLPPAPSSITSNRVPTPVNITESIPMMPDFLVPSQVIHDFSPWTINTVDFPSVDPNNYIFPQIKLSKNPSIFQSDNPFNYPERVQLSFNSSGSGLASSFLDGIDGSSAAGDDESSSGRPSSIRSNASLLVNDVEIKTPYLVIELLANTFKVSPNAIRGKSGLLELINKYPLTEFAQENFRKPSSASSSKKGGSPSYDEELTFSDKPLSKPLLKKVKNNLKPFGTTISTSILQFIGVIQGYNQIIVAHNLCQIIQPHQELIDETYFQIIKQATNNPNPNWCQNCYLLFLIICTFFKPRKSNRLYILSWAAHHLLENNFKIRELFAFSMIRFESRFLRGTYKDEITINIIKTIPSQIERASTLFECSIFEIMWAQRKRYPHLPIPIPLALIIKELVKKNAIKTPNLLDLPCDNEKMDYISSNMLTDHKLIENLNVGDLMGLLKNWLLSISDPLISRSTFNNFLHYESPLEYTNCMPSAHRDSLKFLVGFLQDILNHDDENNSTGSKLANVFGPLIVDPTEIVHTQEIYDAIIARSSQFVKDILFSWQTSDIYPLSNEYFDPPKKEKPISRTNLTSQNMKGPQNKRNSVCPLRSPPISPSNSSGSIPPIAKDKI